MIWILRCPWSADEETDTQAGLGTSSKSVRPKMFKENSSVCAFEELDSAFGDTVFPQLKEVAAGRTHRQIGKLANNILG